MHVYWESPGSLDTEIASEMGSFCEHNLAADHGREICICCGQLGVESAPKWALESFYGSKGNGEMDVPVSLNPIDVDIQLSGQWSERQERQMLVMSKGRAREVLVQRGRWAMRPEAVSEERGVSLHGNHFPLAFSKFRFVQLKIQPDK